MAFVDLQSSCFKLPSLVSKQKPPLQFREFEWVDVSIEQEVGSGTFGSDCTL